MQRKLTWITLLIVSFHQVIANDSWISGNLTSYHPVFYANKVYLYKAQPQRGFNLIDSAFVAESGSFLFKTPFVKQTDLFYLGFKNGKLITLLLSPTDTVVLSATAADFNNGMATISGSKENEVFKQLELVRADIESEMEQRDKIAKSMSPFDPKYNALSTNLRETFYKKLQLGNATIAKIVKENKALTATNVLAGLYLHPLKTDSRVSDTAYDNNLSYQHYHYFSKMNMDDSRLAAFNYFYDKLDIYFKQYVDGTSFNGLKEGVDITMKSIQDISLRDAAALYLINVYSKKNDYEVVEYVFNTYYQNTGCETDEQHSDVSDILERLRNVSVGSIAPTITLPDATGASADLHAQAKSSKLTMVMFWASWCPHCTDAMPDVKKVMERYRDSGLSLYAVSLDHTREDWLKYIQNKPMNWTNVCEGKGPKTNVTKVYGVHGTPTFFLIDKEAKIYYRSTDLSEVEEKIKGLL
jgi:thiol-disulfide isomerase/thioredoxin